MSTWNQVLEWGPFARIRRNHALEHATLQVMAERIPHLRMAGYSDQRGFWLIGEAETAQIEEGVRLALNRLNGGEHQLAIHPNCGTNLVTSAVMAGGFAWLGMLGVDGKPRKQAERLPTVISLVALALLIAQPLGPLVQARLTTSAATQGMEIIKVERVQRNGAPLHRVLTQF